MSVTSDFSKDLMAWERLGLLGMDAMQIISTDWGTGMHLCIEKLDSILGGEVSSEYPRLAHPFPVDPTPREGLLVLPKLASGFRT